MLDVTIQNLYNKMLDLQFWWWYLDSVNKEEGAAKATSSVLLRNEGKRLANPGREIRSQVV
jgi:hypothetical protein